MVGLFFGVRIYPWSKRGNKENKNVIFYIPYIRKRKINICFDRLLCSIDYNPLITKLIHDLIEISESYLSIEKELEEKLRSYFSDKRSDSDR